MDSPAVEKCESNVDEANTLEGSDKNMDDDDIAMETKEVTNPYEYTERDQFTSEIYKVEIDNLPRNYGFVQLKKRLSVSLKLNPHKIKAMPKASFAYVTFKNAADRDEALVSIQGHVWKGRALTVKKALPAADPLLKKRKQEAEQQQEEKKKQKVESSEDDKLSPDDRLVKTVAPYWGMPYQEQLQKKEEDMKDVLTFIAKNRQTRETFFKQRKQHDGMCCPLLPIIPSPVLGEYRNKSEFSIGKCLNDEEVLVGFRFGLYKDGVCSVGAPDNVPTIPPAMKNVVRCFRRYLLTSPYSVFNPLDHTGHWHQLTVRTTRGADIMAIAEFHPQQLSKGEMEAVQETMREFFTDGGGKESGVTSLYFHKSRARCTGDHKDEPFDLVKGDTHIYEELLGLKFRISPEAFFQVNTLATETLYGQIAGLCELTPSTTVLDICCGTGTIGLTLAKRVEKVLGVEMCQQAVDDARENARINGISNVRYYCSKAEDVIHQMVSSLWSKDVVAIVDPPRAGLHKKVVKTLRGCHKLKRLIYVSCNARSAKNNFIDLIRGESKKHRGGGFLPVKAIPIDMFPQTPHCELIILFQRDMDSGGGTNTDAVSTEVKKHDVRGSSGEKSNTVSIDVNKRDVNSSQDKTNTDTAQTEGPGGTVADDLECKGQTEVGKAEVEDTS